MFLAVITLLTLFFPFMEAGLTASTHLRRRGPLSTKDAIAAYTPQGLCLYYVKDQNREAMLAPCKAWCPTQNPGMDPDAVGVRVAPVVIRPH